MPDRGEPGHVPQRLALPAAADQHRNRPGRRWVQDLQPGGDPRQVVAQQVEPGAGCAELVAVLVVVLFEPATPDPEDQPAIGDVVDGARHVGQQVGVAVTAPGHQRTDLDPLGLLGPGAEHRPAFEVLAVGVAVQRIEVVPVEDDVDAEVLGAEYGVPDGAVIGVLWLELDADADRPVRCSHAPTVRTRSWRVGSAPPRPAPIAPRLCRWRTLRPLSVGVITLSRVSNATSVGSTDRVGEP